jgi:hypothetical protein
VGDLESALPCLVQSGEWQSLLITAGQLGFNASQRQQLARSAADVLASGLSRFAEAGRLMVDVCGAVEEGITMFCEGSSWLDALNTVRSSLVFLHLYGLIHWLCSFHAIAHVNVRPMRTVAPTWLTARCDRPSSATWRRVAMNWPR